MRAPRSALLFKRTFNLQFWQPSTVNTSDFWRFYGVRPSDMPSWPELTALFDEYRINAIKFTFRPRFDNFSGNDTTDVTLPGVINQALTNLHIITDPYSTTVPSGLYTRANLNTFLEQGSVKSYTGSRPINVYYKPTTYITADGSATGKLVRSPWLLTTNPAQHYGFHAFAQDPNLTGVFGNGWDVFVTFYIQCRRLK